MILSYVYNPHAKIRAVDVNADVFFTRFTVLAEGERLGEVKLKASGEHNVKNALAAVAIGLELGMSFSDIRTGIEKFDGVFRRFQPKHVTEELIVIDDYAQDRKSVV